MLIVWIALIIAAFCTGILIGYKTGYDNCLSEWNNVGPDTSGFIHLGTAPDMTAECIHGVYPDDCSDCRH